MLTYSQLDFQDLREQFGVEIRRRAFLPVPLTPLSPPSWLVEFLTGTELPLAISKSEKALSEAIIYPILAAIQRHHKHSVGLFSGEPLAAAGLAGVCDFIFSLSPDTFEARPPIVVLVEAKRQDLLKAVPQCVGEMIAAQFINQAANVDFPTIYGCVTTGLQWQFLRLTDREATVDPQLFNFPAIGDIMAVLDWIIRQFKP